MSSALATTWAANRGLFVLIVVALLLALSFYAYRFFDSAGVAEQRAQAVVTAKQHFPPGVTYRTTIVAGRSWTQADSTAEQFVLVLAIGDETTGAAIEKQRYDNLRVKDTVTVRYRRLRFSGRLEVDQVN